MQTRFLLGPAGSGKTFRCLKEIRAELLRDPAGPPLLLLAPKQATFQLERQLLNNDWWAERTREPHQLQGYTRLQIISFNRLAEFILAELNPVQPDWLDDEGRVMVLRALLMRHGPELKTFHATARLPGLAKQLSRLLRELQQHQLSAAHLRALAKRIAGPSQLKDKLHDFALLLDRYQDWLEHHQLQDADGLQGAAAGLLRADREASVPFHLGGLWMDGFAELTPQEVDLLAAVVPRSAQATLAFCLPQDVQETPGWLSPWAVIGQTYLRCCERVAAMPGVAVATEIMERVRSQQRFHSAPALAHLEKGWSTLAPFDPTSPDARSTGLELFSCANPEAEAVLAAREIRRFVREGGRYRETAVLVRSLDDYAHVLRRVFDRYEIPCFLDRREPVTHHPLAELTRYALRTVAFGWRQQDWFGALKTGLVSAREAELDWLENLALEHGWEGKVWRHPLPPLKVAAQHERAEAMRTLLVAPFIALAAHIGADAVTGPDLAAALRRFWAELRVERTLEGWTTALEQPMEMQPAHNALHSTVWDQANSWLTNLEHAFRHEALLLRDWLPVLESGLANLTVGVIPPALDQVLIGAIDRSRNPDLKLAIVPGLNEGVFPAHPIEDPLLNEVERIVLASEGTSLGFSSKHRIGHEWFYGYIACTRASQRLVLTCSEFDAGGNPLNRSAFFDHIIRLFPGHEVRRWQIPDGLKDAEHLTELIPPAIQLANSQSDNPATQSLLALPELSGVMTKAASVRSALKDDVLSPVAVESLYGSELASSVSGLENFAACPFKFFVGHGLRAEERKRFELDARERGSFQHDVLQRFHEQLLAENLRWRDVRPAEACERVEHIARALLPHFGNGLFQASNARRFEGEMLVASLRTLMSVLSTWAQNYQFDPALVEVGFGLRESSWPAWRLELDDRHAVLLRGRIDRVDVWRDPQSGAALAVVMDYKSSSRSPDRLKLQCGLQLQLPAYLAALEGIPGVPEALNTHSTLPAGMFYVNLRGEFKPVRKRATALDDPSKALRLGFQHVGRFDASVLPMLDPSEAGEQFKTSSRAHNQLATAAFRELLETTVANLKKFGREIYSGRIAPDPFRKGSETACESCDYASVCRFDPWRQPYRTLTLTEKEADE